MNSFTLSIVAVSLSALFLHITTVDAIGNDWFYGNSGGAGGCQTWLPGQYASIEDMRQCSQVSELCSTDPTKTICEVFCWDTRCMDILQRCDNCQNATLPDSFCVMMFDESCEALSTLFIGGHELVWDNTEQVCLCKLDAGSILELSFGDGHMMWFENVDEFSSTGVSNQVCPEMFEDQLEREIRAIQRIFVGPTENQTIVTTGIQWFIAPFVQDTYACIDQVNYGDGVSTNQFWSHLQTSYAISFCGEEWNDGCAATLPAIESGGLIYAYNATTLVQYPGCSCVWAYDDGFLSQFITIPINDVSWRLMKPSCVNYYEPSCQALSDSIPATYFEVTSIIFNPPPSGVGCYCIIYADIDDSIVQRHGPLSPNDVRFLPSAVTTLSPTADTTTFPTPP